MTDRRERQKQARQAQRQTKARQQAKRETMRRIRTALGVGIAVAVVLLATANLGGQDTTLPPDYQRYRDQPTACGADLPEPAKALAFDAAEDQALEGPVQALLVTSCGELTMTLEPSLAPQTVNSFAFLARQGFYDGTVFHRIVEGFVIQGGDPDASGFGGPGYVLPDEFPPDAFVYERGVVAMANAGRGTTGSQFFIVSGAQGAALPNSFTVIGRVTGGLEVLDAIAAVPTTTRPGQTEQSLPTETVYLERVTIGGS
jgi:cyclophilin family peptidyl-prolyl cis-trans isomerase